MVVASKFLSKKIRLFKRWRKRKLPLLFGALAFLILGTIFYAYYMGAQFLSVNPASCKPLLDLIAHAESSGNYNAYFGNGRNTKIRFTDMSIADVLKWQKDYVAQGSPSSAVGRYQFLNTTLAGLVDKHDINPNQKFDEKTQDALAITLLEKRGVKEYVNQQLTDKEFAANLAKEWAGLPKVTGENPEQSYYASDGLNKSRVKPSKVLEAIKPIKSQ